MASAAQKQVCGYSLIELLIVVVLAALILSLGIPSYRQYVQRASRGDATSALLRLAAAQERFYLDNDQYAGPGELALDPPAGLGFPGELSERGYYNLAVAPNIGGLTIGYVAIATPVPGGNQSDDTDCALFSINQSGTRTSLPGDTDVCWR